VRSPHAQYLRQLLFDAQQAAAERQRARIGVLRHHAEQIVGPDDAVERVHHRAARRCTNRRR
jgi:hypothetical protein